MLNITYQGDIVRLWKRNESGAGLEEVMRLENVTVWFREDLRWMVARLVGTGQTRIIKIPYEVCEISIDRRED